MAQVDVDELVARVAEQRGAEHPAEVGRRDDGPVDAARAPLVAVRDEAVYATAEDGDAFPQIGCGARHRVGALLLHGARGVPDREVVVSQLRHPMRKRDERMLLVRRRRKDRLRPAEAPAAGVERHLIRAEHELDVRCAVARRLLEQSQRRHEALARVGSVPIAVHHSHPAVGDVHAGEPVPDERRRVPAAHPPGVHARRDSPLVRAARRFVVYGGRRLRRTDAARLRARRDHEELAIDDLHADAEPLCAARLKRGLQLRARYATPERPQRAPRGALQPRGHRRRHVVRGAVRWPPRAEFLAKRYAGVRRVIARIVRRVRPRVVFPSQLQSRRLSARAAVIFRMAEARAARPLMARAEAAVNAVPVRHEARAAVAVRVGPAGRVAARERHGSMGRSSVE